MVRGWRQMAPLGGWTRMIFLDGFVCWEVEGWNGTRRIFWLDLFLELIYNARALIYRKSGFPNKRINSV
jgi:hypothetical protein